MNVYYKDNDFFDFSDAICFIKSNFYPMKFHKKSGFKYEFFLGLGSNKGDSKQIFKKCFLLLKKDKRFNIIQTSVILKNKPFGYLNQNDFLNSVIRLQTSLNPNETLKILFNMEKKFKRERSFKNAPRTLDLDILYFNAKVRYNKKLILPHPGVNERVSVILPIGLMENL